MIKLGDILSNKIERTKILDCCLDVVTMEDALQVISNAVLSREPIQVITLNAEMIYRAQQEPGLKQVFERAGLVTPDGVGVLWALRRTGYQVSRRVTGIGLTIRVLEKAAQEGWKIYLLGAKPGVADAVANLWQARYPELKIAGVHHGYFSVKEETEVIQRVKEAHPDLLLVALGAPRQEYWIARYLTELDVPVCMGVGGTFDVLSGQIKRAPRGWRRLGLEWLYRLIREPSRIKRQIALPRFACLVLREAKSSKARRDT